MSLKTKKEKRFEKVVEWRSKRTGKKVKLSLFLDGEDFNIRNSIYEWVTLIIGSIMYPIIILVYFLKCERKVYWREIK